jgi:hypothetical protein
MRCSLLVLSSYLDNELSGERVAEVDAHIIGCNRCRTAVSYLREESERVGALARVHIPEEAAYHMFVELKLVAPDDLPPPDPRDLAPVVTAAVTSPWVDDTAKPEQHADDLFDQVYASGDVGIDAAAEHAAVDHLDDSPGIELAGLPNQAAYAPPQPPVVHPSVAAGQPPMPPPLPGPPQRLAASAAPGILQRMRDAVSLRLALMRGGAGAHIDENSVQIVTGPGTAAARETGWAYDDDDELSNAEHDEALWPTPKRMSTATAVAEPPRAVEAPAQPRTVELITPETRPAPLAPDHGARRERATSIGRHARSLGIGGRAARPSWMSLASLTRRTHSISLSRPAVGVPAADRRLWAFVAAVVVLGLIGVLVGKSTSSLPQAGIPATAPHPSTAPSLQPSVAPSAAATPVPTPAPTPPPPPASPLHLSDVHTLGSGAAGYHVGGLRYGLHPSDFRMVFDLAGADVGTPRVMIGFGNAITLYVEFVGVMPGGLPNDPLPGNTVVTAHLLSARTIAGRTIYEFDLAHSATVSAYYLVGPARLVVDLRG